MKRTTLLILLAWAASCQNEHVKPEWFETGSSINPDYADVIYFAGTQIDHEYDSTGKEINRIRLTGPEKSKLEGEYKEAYTLLCPDSINFFAPYYNQCTMNGFIALPGAMKEAWRIFRYYMDSINNGRPFIVAGFSQGAIMAQSIAVRLSDEEMSRMKAVYSIGFGLSKLVLLSPNIRPAEGEHDTGVVVSFNSSASKEDIWGMVQVGTDECINPVNWKTDSTPATFQYDGMTLTNHIDPETHHIYIDGFDHSTHPSILPGVAPKWTGKNLHVYEVRMYAPFLRRNIKDRAYR